MASPYERARSFSAAQAAPRQFWAEHEGLPDRPKGAHAFTLENTPEAAIDNLRDEASSVESRGGLKDGRHKFTVFEHTPTGPKAVVQGFHEVRNGKTVEGTGSGFAPDLGGAKNYIKGWFAATTPK